MLADYQRSRRHQPFPLLVIEDNTDHQLLIGYSLREQIPLAQPVFATAVEEALSHLALTVSEAGAFPRLVLLDLYLPDLSAGWYLLQEIRQRYPRLPVIILSSHQEAAIIRKAYELGAHSFLCKPFHLEEWEYQFRVFNEYWLNTTVLPPS